MKLAKLKIEHILKKKSDTQETPQNQNLSVDDRLHILRCQYYKDFLKTRDPLLLASAVMYSDKGGIIFDDEHHIIHKTIHNFIKEYEKYDILIQVFVGGGKTTHICSMVANYIYENTAARCLIITGHNKLAVQRKTLIQTYYETLLKIENKFIPCKNPNNNRNFMKCTSNLLRVHGAIHKEDTIDACSYESSSMGNRADLIILDDVEQDDNGNELEKLKKRFNQAIRDRKSGEARTIIINTPYHINGFIKSIEKSNRFVTLKMGLSTKLLDEDKLALFEQSLEKIDDTFIREKIKRLIKIKDIFAALNIFNTNQLLNYYDKLKACLDFKIYKQIIMHGEILSEEILPEWDWLIENKGAEILDKYLEQRPSYMLTHALNPEKANISTFFKHHNESLISLEKYQSMIQGKQYIRFYSYDIANEGSEGLVITEFCLIQDGKCIVIGQYSDTGGAVAIQKNIEAEHNCIHVIENNSGQKNVIQLIRYNIPDHLKKLILEHNTQKEYKEDAIRGIISIDRAFKNRDLFLLETGQGIEKLINKISFFNNIFNRHNKHDNIMSLWIGYYNINRVKNKFIDLTNSQNNNILRVRSRNLPNV